MKTRRKIQFGAAAVIANSVLALGLMAPRSALATPCQPKLFCGYQFCTGLAFCQGVADPGCTATSQTCEIICGPSTLCLYQ